MTSEPTRYDQVPSGCWAACIAGLTGIPHEDLASLVPKQGQDDSEWTKYRNAVNRWTRANGWRIAHVGPDVPAGFAIGTGDSPRGLRHAVIVKDGVLWHDPHPSRAGVVKIETYDVLIPLIGGPLMDTLRDAA